MKDEIATEERRRGLYYTSGEGKGRMSLVTGREN
jgi:hypothetical protein